jgi:hypothetical protein
MLRWLELQVVIHERGERTSEGRDLGDLDVFVLCELPLQPNERVTLNIITRSSPQHLKGVCIANTPPDEIAWSQQRGS